MNYFNKKRKLDIKGFQVKLHKEKIVSELNEDSLNYPILMLTIKGVVLKFFYRENFVKRTKFIKKYNSFLEVTSSSNIELKEIKKNIQKIFDSPVCIEKQKLFIKTTKADTFKIIDFIKNINS